MRDGAAAIIFGTRPEAVKLAPLLWEMSRQAYVIHTGQHALDSLTEIMRDVGIGPPQRSVTPADGPAGRRVGHAIDAVIDALAAAAPDVVVVQGDTNSTLAGAIAASTLGLPLVHVEAGLRAFDRQLPEERNRVAVDHLADLLCAPTPAAVAHLRAEGITDRVLMTGNTVVDATLRCLPDPLDRVAIRARHGVERDAYVLATFHRQENVDDLDHLETIVDELAALPLPVVFPIHPRTADRAAHLGVTVARGAVTVVPPLGYREFLALAADSALIVTDSGGVQEEASVFGRPVVVVRRSTERPEVEGTVATVVAPGPLIGATARTLLADLPSVHARLRATPSPFGDGTAGRRIVDAITDLVG